MKSPGETNLDPGWNISRRAMARRLDREAAASCGPLSRFLGLLVSFLLGGSFWPGVVSQDHLQEVRASSQGTSFREHIVHAGGIHCF